jgi:uncharacterized membrane protein (UPF0136 family)
MTDTGPTSPFDEPPTNRPPTQPAQPEQPQQPPSYPSYPQMPGYAEGPTEPPPTPPQDVDRASKILYGLAGLGILNTLLSFTMRDQIRDAIADRYPDYTADELDSTVNAFLAIAVVVGIVFALIYILLARKILQGRSWARIVATILLALNALNLLSVGQPQPAVLRALGVIAALVAIAALVFLWRRPASEFFAAHARRRAYRG